ncbi:MAG: ABC transporter substrate binding protein [Spirochaetales bacterium]|uniref:ABC transporter substrate binding protein n=1 Tax=Candidatus Thalassospirochaeta sargassi TaxID=3119039 RepID=A0AAJ1IB21_9SPIO|nr:ABC transporter substrate binding protein [Spirochaetales bacterium]
MNKYFLKIIFISLILPFFSITFIFSEDKDQPVIAFIDSYHEGYSWSDRILRGVEDVLSVESVSLRVYRMDTKRNPGEQYKSAEGRRVRDSIIADEPDVIIASDDNASKYVIEPFFKDSHIPVVFCGVNWDAGIYGYPYDNSVGMVEVNMITELINQLSAFSPSYSGRLGYLASDTYTERNEADYYKIKFGIKLFEERYVDSFEQWKEAFLEIQEKVDILIVGTIVISDFDQIEAEQFVLDNIKIPTGVLNGFLMPYALLGYLKVPEELGIWSAQTALQIINGKPVSGISDTTNKLSDLLLNLKIADRLDIVFKTDLLKYAEILR